MTWYDPVHTLTFPHFCEGAFSKCSACIKCNMINMLLQPLEKLLPSLHLVGACRYADIYKSLATSYVYIYMYTASSSQTHCLRPHYTVHSPTTVSYVQVMWLAHTDSENLDYILQQKCIKRHESQGQKLWCGTRQRTLHCWVHYSLKLSSMGLFCFNSHTVLH